MVKIIKMIFMVNFDHNLAALFWVSDYQKLTQAQNLTTILGQIGPTIGISS